MRIGRCFLSVFLLAAGLAAQQEDHSQHQAMMEQMKKAPDATRAEMADGLNIPDIRLLDQTGKAVNFYSDLVQDKVVAMNFIFTTCTTICPPMGANFARLQKELGERAGRDVQLISVSVDPTTDTPQRLQAWAQRFGAGPGWTLVTGPKPEVDRLLKALQVFTPDFVDHSPTVLVGNDARGRWMRAYGLAPPEQLNRLIQQVEEAEDVAREEPP